MRPTALALSGGPLRDRSLPISDAFHIGKESDTKDGGSVLHYWDRKRAKTLELLDFTRSNQDVTESWESTRVRGAELAGERVGYDRDKAQKTYQRYRQSVERVRGSPKIPAVSIRVRLYLDSAETGDPQEGGSGQVSERPERYRRAADYDLSTREGRDGLRAELGDVSRAIRNVGSLPAGRARSGIRTIAKAITAPLFDPGRASLQAQTINSAEDLAVIGHVTRDPRFETFRIICVKEL